MANRWWVCGLALGMTAVAAARPLTLAHQVRIVDASGAAVNGTVPVVVTLWRDATSTLPADRLWLDTRTETLEDGYASLVLALADDGTTLDSAWFSGPVWLELTVNGTPMSPRQRVLDVPGAGSPVSTGTRPATAAQGDLYFNNNTATLDVYDAGAWTPVRAFDPIATSCNELRTGGVLQSGTYNIDVDGNGPLAAQGLYCDMTLDGGGWTQVFVATTTDYNTGNIGYIAGTDLVRSGASEMLFAFVDPASGVLTQPWKFAMPAVFQTTTPMAATQCGYANVTAFRLADNTSVTSILRYGTGSFGSTCDEGCTSTWGQVCLKSVGTPQGTAGGVSDFPFFSSYVSGSQGVDHCSRSDQTYTATACSATRRFAIFVR